MQRIAIAGGGPAGAFAGERLAAAGFPVTILDDKLAWEKPCGGGLTAKALERYPFLATGDAPKRMVERAVLIASNGAAAPMRLRQPIAIYSRQVLNGLLLERAARAGAVVVRDRVLEAERSDGVWRLRGKLGCYQAEFSIIATGARNPLRSLGTELRPADAFVALGYYVPGQQDHIEIQFLKEMEGYIWVFPRPDHLSVGICGKGDTPRLRRMLEQYMGDRGIPFAGSRFYCHLLPSLTWRSFRRNRLSGDGWAAAGDAAGLVDPITGEGLYYALRSAEVAADCLIAGRASEYPRRIWAEMGEDLERGARLSRRFYRGRFLMGPVTTRMVEFCRRSPTFAALMQDLIAGSQGYLGLKRRLLRQLGVTLAEIAASAWRAPASDESYPISSAV